MAKYNPDSAFEDDEFEDDEFESSGYKPLEEEGSADDLFPEEFNFSGSSNRYQQEESGYGDAVEAGASKKVAICGAVLGVVVILCAVGLNAKLSNLGNNKVAKQEVTTSNVQTQHTQTQPVQDIVKVQPTQEVVQNPPVQTQQVQESPVISVGGTQEKVQVINSEDPNYRKFEVGYHGEQSVEYDDVFTVEKFDGYLVNGVMLEYYAVGKLGKFEGTYRVNLGYDIVNKLDVGMSFKVRVKTLAIGESTIVSSILTN